MRHLLPHAFLAVVTLLFLGGHIGGRDFLIGMVLGHLAVPIWSAWISTRKTEAIGILLGPLSIIAVHTIVIVVAWVVTLGAPGGATWIVILMLVGWMAALALYAVYCTLAYQVTRSLRRPA